MNLVLDTCIFVRNDAGQRPVPGFNYNLLEKLINDSNNSVFVSGFSLPEIYMLRDYKTLDDLIVGLSEQNISLLDYTSPINNTDLCKYDILNKYSATMFFHLTQFLEFFVVEVIVPFDLADIESLFETIRRCTELFHKKIGETNLENCTKFMKEKSVDYIVECIEMVFKNYGKFLSHKEIWGIIADSHIGSFLARNVDVNYLRYGRFLKQLFKSKLKNGAAKIKLKFGLIDLLIAHASENNFVVLTSDKEMAQYLLKYGNKENKHIISSLWNGLLSPAKY